MSRVREEGPADHAAIRAVVAGGFGRPDEATLVDALRRDGDLALSLVALADGAIVAHLALSHLLSPPRALALAPLAVAPSHRRRGLGAALVATGIDWARGHGFALLFVVGEPAYYERFGFSAATAAPYPSPLAGRYFMALALRGPVHAPAAPVVYASAFAGLD